MRILVFGEIYSPNVGDGIIFDCIRHGLAARGCNAIPADLALRKGFSTNAAKADAKPSSARKLARYFVRRSLFLRRLITITNWLARERRRFIDRYAESIRSCDGIVIGGGQILTSRQFGFPPRIWTIIDLAEAAGKPVAIYSCGMDARQGFVTRHIFRRVARYARYICVRDPMSADTFRALDGNLAVHSYPDIGFLTGRLYPADNRVAGKTLGLNIMPHESLAAFFRGAGEASRQNYLEFWSGLVHSALDQGWRVHILTNGDAADQAAAKEIHALFAEDERVSLPPPPANPDGLVETLNDVDALITSRMHAGIVAYSLGKRVVPLTWDEKVRGVWAEADPTVRLFTLDDLYKGKASASAVLENTLEGLDTERGGTMRERRPLADRLDRSLDELVARLAGISSEVQVRAGS